MYSCEGLLKPSASTHRIGSQPEVYMFFSLLALSASLVVSWITFGTARRFVRERLRFVDAALRPSAPIIAGLGVALLAVPMFNILHLIPLVGAIVGGGTGLITAIGAGLGVRQGATDIRNGYVIGPGA